MGEKEKSEGYRSDRSEGHRSDHRGEGYGEYYEHHRREDRSRPASPGAGGSRETFASRRVKPKLDFLRPEGGGDNAFHDIKDPSQLAHNSVRRIKVKPVANMANSDSADLDDLINFFQEKEGEGSEKEKLSDNPFSALFPTLELAQCYSDSHKSPVIEESSENKRKLQEYINRIRRV